MEKILRRDKSPLAENPFAKQDQSSPMTPIERATAAAPPLEPDIQKCLTNFSLITHGFGGPAMVAVLNAFRHYLNSMKSNYEKMLNGMDTGGISTTDNKPETIEKLGCPTDLFLMNMIKLSVKKSVVG